jgi:N-acetyl sugar amidotransferase
MPDTRPGIKFNKEGVCYPCLNHEKKKSVDWDGRWDEFMMQCEPYRWKKGHNCIIAVSGGKDSHYQVHVVKELMGMNPLLVSVADNFTMTEAGKHNVKNLSEEFGCDIITLNPNIKDQKIVADYTFKQFLKPTWYIDRLIYSYPLHMAVKFKIPLVFYGENISYEYGGENAVESPSALTQISNGVASDIDIDELNINTSFLKPPAPNDMMGLEPTYLSYFVPWNSYKNYLFAKSRGFKDLANEWERSNHIENFDQIDSIAYLIHPWLKYPKFGHSVATDYASKFVRYGMMTRAEAINLVKKHDHAIDQKTIDDFCSFMGYSLSQFWDIVNTHYNRDIFRRDENGQWKLKQPIC